MDPEERKAVGKTVVPGDGADAAAAKAVRRKETDDRIVAPWFGWLTVAVAVALGLFVWWLEKA